MGSTEEVDYRNWDWLPGAASEIESYLERLLAEAAITAHSVNGRAKSISSFQRKIAEKNYTDPVRQVTDSVAVRIITYSVTDRDRAVELIRNRFSVLPGEDRSPGDSYPSSKRGYDCRHLVVNGEQDEDGSGWLTSGGDLIRYFRSFGGLEIQVRTVAAHAWAEFEHARRYKGEAYDSISRADQETIDGLFGAASDARKSLDETFIAIDRLLANPPSASTEQPHEAGQQNVEHDRAYVASDAPLSPDGLRDFLERRYSDDNPGSEAGLKFGCDLVEACGIGSIEDLKEALDDIDAERVKRLMNHTVAVTGVRRLDDELLATFGEKYIDATGALGNVTSRHDQLKWRYDRVRGKSVRLV